jgi:hypothetical protein
VINEARRGDGPESRVTLQRFLKPLSIRPYVNQRKECASCGFRKLNVIRLLLKSVNSAVLRDVTFRSVDRC